MSTQHTPGPVLTGDMIETGALQLVVESDGALTTVEARVRAEAVFRAMMAVAPADPASELLGALLQIDGEAPAQETRDGPSVGFPPSRDPEIDDGNDVVREAFDEGVCRGLAIAAEIARAAIAKVTGVEARLVEMGEGS